MCRHRSWRGDRGRRAQSADDADLSRLPGDDADRPARGRGDAALFHREVRQSRIRATTSSAGNRRRRWRRRASRSAALIGADPREIVFTSGATEANNLALKGAMRFHKDKKNHLITCVTEHKCVLESARHLEREGFEVTYLPVQPNGLVDLAVLEAAITPQDGAGLDHGGEQRDRRDPAAWPRSARSAAPRASISTPTRPRPSARSRSMSRR